MTSPGEEKEEKTQEQPRIEKWLMRTDLLYIDMDIPYDMFLTIEPFYRRHLEYWSTLRGIRLKSIAHWRSQNNNTHISIKLIKPITYLERIHAELCLGGDIYRQYYMFNKYLAFKKDVEFLFHGKLKESRRTPANIDMLQTVKLEVEIPANLYKELAKLEFRLMKPLKDIIVEALLYYTLVHLR